MVGGLANQGFEDFGKLLGHTIGDRSTVRHCSPKGSAWLVDLGEAIELRGDTACGVHGLVIYTI